LALALIKPNELAKKMNHDCRLFLPSFATAKA